METDSRSRDFSGGPTCVGMDALWREHHANLRSRHDQYRKRAATTRTTSISDALTAQFLVHAPALAGGRVHLICRYFGFCALARLEVLDLTTALSCSLFRASAGDRSRLTAPDHLRPHYPRACISLTGRLRRWVSRSARFCQITHLHL